MRNNTYITIEKPSKVVIYKEKGSKFLGLAFPLHAKNDIKKHLSAVKNDYKGANHYCYAYHLKLGLGSPIKRASDGGEPSGSAGMPILRQIQSNKLTNVLIVVIRYFGGIKLGIGGLIRSYRETAKQAIENSMMIKRLVSDAIMIKFDYKAMGSVMRLINRYKARVVKQNMELKCEFEISIRSEDLDSISKDFSNLHEVEYIHVKNLE